MFTAGSVCRVKRFTTGSRNSLKDIWKSKTTAPPGAEVGETTVRDYYAVGFDALVKRWDKCISVGGGYVEKRNVFFPGSNITCFTFYIHLWSIYWLSPVCTSISIFSKTFVEVLFAMWVFV
jgi:hypothetical protein